MRPSLARWLAGGGDAPPAAPSPPPPPPEFSGGGSHKPFTTPPDFKAPSLAEQWQYAWRRHPYARHASAAALFLGAAGAAAAAWERRGTAAEPDASIKM
jgi:hypothetical protein